MTDTDETADTELYGFWIPGDRAFRGRLTLHEWQDLWRACRDHDSALSLLHILFRATKGENRGSYGGPDYDTDRILFLLHLADFKNVQHHIDIRTKARDILASEFFGKVGYDQVRHVHPKVYAALRDFFAHRNAWWNPESRDVTHTDKVMSKYLREFCRINARHGPDDFRIWLADLDFTGECCEGAFETLLPENLNQVKWDLFSDAVFMARLEELALKDCETVEDAVFKGSRSAKALVLIRAGLTGRERNREASELKERIKRDTDALCALK